MANYSQWLADNQGTVDQVGQRIGTGAPTPQQSAQVVPDAVDSVAATRPTGTSAAPAGAAQPAAPAQAGDSELTPDMKPKEGKGAGIGKILGLVGSFFGGGVIGKVLGAVGGQMAKQGGGEQQQGGEGGSGGAQGGSAPDWSTTAQKYIGAFTGR
jgi:hypothetical protein